MPPYVDLAAIPEDNRIDLIGHQAMVHNLKLAFFVETNEKADRYIAKLEKKFPGIRVIARGDGPVEGTVFVKVGPPEIKTASVQ